MKICVLGNGSWGTAIASLSRRRGHEIQLWGRKPRTESTVNMAVALKDAEIVFMGIPSHAMREIGGEAAAYLAPQSIIVSLAKGIEQDTHLRMSEVIQMVTKREEIAVLSGPSFASEVQKGGLTALVCAAKSEVWAKKVQQALHGEDFRVYTHEDVTGVELGGALKNVMAIASGACVGLGLGDNAVAALITRGLAELSRIGIALGGQAKTFYGLSGVGDLILTCSSQQSRNRRLGEGLGHGKSLDEILTNLQGTAEGVKTARSVQQILEKHQLDAPIMQEIYKVLYEGKSVRETVKCLMDREPKREFQKSA